MDRRAAELEDWRVEQARLKGLTEHLAAEREAAAEKAAAEKAAAERAAAEKAAEEKAAASEKAAAEKAALQPELPPDLPADGAPIAKSPAASSELVRSGRPARGQCAACRRPDAACAAKTPRAGRARSARRSDRERPLLRSWGQAVFALAVRNLEYIDPKRR